MRVLIDMNLSPRWIDLLSGAGIRAVHWSTIGERNASDQEIMAFAAQHGDVVLTHDLDFGAILAAAQGEKPSVVQIRAVDVSPASIGPQVIAALRQLDNELRAGALVTVDTSRSRLRVLPLRTTP
jgi:predicted nuclease of predicted toxin-antitoxin system